MSTTRTVEGCTDATLDALLASVASIPNQPEDVPPGWYTATQAARRARLARVTIDARLRQGVAAGILERRQFRVDVGGKVTSVWHYRRRGE